jgi:hypothetical protein
MKKLINLFLGISLLFGFSLSLFSQANQKTLDQVQLVKKMIGTWQGEISPDTTYIIDVVPSGGGLYWTLEYKAKGKTYSTNKSLIGFSQDRETISFFALWQNGTFSIDKGRFISDNKMVLERYIPGSDHPIGLLEITFPTPDVIDYTLMWRGPEITWDPVWTYKWHTLRVKE